MKSPLDYLFCLKTFDALVLFSESRYVILGLVIDKGADVLDFSSTTAFPTTTTT